VQSLGCNRNPAQKYSRGDYENAIGTDAGYKDLLVHMSLKGGKNSLIHSITIARPYYTIVIIAEARTVINDGNLLYLTSGENRRCCRYHKSYHK